MSTQTNNKPAQYAMECFYERKRDMRDIMHDSFKRITHEMKHERAKVYAPKDCC